MILTNGEIFAIAEGLEALKDTGVKLPIKEGFALLRDEDNIKPLLQNIFTVRQEICEKYGTQSADGGYTIPDENIEATNKELNELAAIENDVQIYQLRYAVLDKLGVEMKLEDLQKIYKLVDMEEEA